MPQQQATPPPPRHVVIRTPLDSNDDAYVIAGAGAAPTAGASVSGAQMGAARRVAPATLDANANTNTRVLDLDLDLTADGDGTSVGADMLIDC